MVRATAITVPLNTAPQRTSGGLSARVGRARVLMVPPDVMTGAGGSRWSHTPSRWLPTSDGHRAWPHFGPRDRTTRGYPPGRGSGGGRRRPGEHRQRRAVGERLQDHAVALGGGEQIGALLFGGDAGEVEDQADRAEPHRRLAVDAQRSPEVEVAFGAHGALHGQTAVGGDGAQ